MFSYGSITEQGLVAINKSNADGKKLTITRLSYGDGIYDSTKKSKSKKELNIACSKQTALKNKCADIEIATFKVNGVSYTITGLTKKESVTNPFRIYELGVYAQLEGEQEFLFAYYTSIDYINGENDQSDYLSPEQLEGQDRKVIVTITIGTTDYIEINVNHIGDYIDSSTFNNTVSQIYEAIDNVDFSHYEHYDFVIDSDEKFRQWADTSDKSATKVLVKKGTYTLNGKMLNILKTGTKHILGVPGSKLVFNYQKGIGVGEKSNETFVIENVDIEVNDDSEEDAYGIYYGAIARNCNIVVNSSNGSAYGFRGCSTDNCTALSIGAIAGYGFFDCSYCTRSRAGGESTTKTWGGINIKIDTNTCDN